MLIFEQFINEGLIGKKTKTMIIQIGKRIKRLTNIRFIIILNCLMTSSIFFSCSTKHTDKIEINSRNSIFFSSEVWGVGGGHYNFKITDSRYFHKDSRTIDFGDIGDLPIMYELRNNKLVIHTYLQDLDYNKMPELVSFKIYDNGIYYVQKLDSVKKGLIGNIKIYYPMPFLVDSIN